MHGLEKSFMRKTTLHYISTTVKLHLQTNYPTNIVGDFYEKKIVKMENDSPVVVFRKTEIND